MALIRHLVRGLDGQRGHLLPWLPVCFAAGIGWYFSLPAEPAVWVPAALCALVAACGALAWRHAGAAPLLLAVAAVAAGLAMAALRAHAVAEPVLGFRYYGPVEGRVIAIDRSASDRTRITLDRVRLTDTAPGRTPARVRVALHGMAEEDSPAPGATVMLTGHLAPPSGPAEPGGYDFQRQAWFQKIGAVGYTRTPVLTVSPPETGVLAPLGVFRLRMHMSQAVRAALPGEAGGIAAAILTGDRSGIGQDTLEALRLSNLAHLLAISGLHMGLLTGVVFGALRLGMAAVPALALRRPIRKYAAVGALLAGAVYYLLSGGNVATERAFVMVAVVLSAVMLDRRALTLRAVAVAAMIVLTLRPESLMGPGFQMSFAATVALVGAFGALRDWKGWQPPRWARGALAVVLSSAVAGAATAPVAAAHFNRIADYGLIANLLSVPLMGAVVMPAAVLAACLAPLGLGWIGLAVMRPPIEWILGVAHRVAEWPGAVTHVPSPPGAVLPLLALGGLTVLLWQGRGRLGGVLPMAAALALWVGADRPVLLLSQDAALVGLMTGQGRALSKPRGQGFAAQVWLENDGDGAGQAEAHARPGFDGADGLLRFAVGGRPMAHLSGRGASARLAEACAGADLVILAGVLDGPAPCTVMDRDAAERLGATAFHVGPDGLRRVGARQAAGARLWNTRQES